MKKRIDKNELTDELRDVYDFSELGEYTRGKHAESYHSSKNLILLDSDVAEVFPNDSSVNEALRLLMKIANPELWNSQKLSRIGVDSPRASAIAMS